MSHAVGRSSLVSFSLLLALAGCKVDGAFDGDVIGDASESAEGSESGVECTYPGGAVEPMALGEVLTAYSWPTAIHADGTTTSLDLLNVPCATDEVIDWSIHELLVFISVPAW